MTGQRVVVVGAGPAGLAAATAAATLGASVVVFDERDEPGGQLLYRAQPIEAAAGLPAERPDVLRERLVAEALAAGVSLELGTLVAAAYPGSELLVVKGERGRRLEASAVIIATGSTDLPYPFAGATFPGVFSARAVQIMLNQWRVRPGRRFAIVGGGPAVDELAIDILLAGGEVVWSGIAPAPFLRVQGEDGVRALHIGPEQAQVDVDVVAIAVGRQPDAALARMIGASFGFSATLGGLTPIVDDTLASNLPGYFVAGDVAGAGSAGAAIAEGRLAGVAAAAALGLADDAAVEQARTAGGEELAWRIEQRAGLTAVPAQPFA